MKRARLELDRIASFENIGLAAWKAAKGKRCRSDVIAFYSDFEKKVVKLSNDIMAGRSPYGVFKKFTINDPKERMIHAACFEDRIMHHADCVSWLRKHQMNCREFSV